MHRSWRWPFFHSEPPPYTLFLQNEQVNGLPFSEIMNQAVKLKTHMAKSDRSRYSTVATIYRKGIDSTIFICLLLSPAHVHTVAKRWDGYPKFFQNSMFSREDVDIARSLPFDGRFAAAMAIKGDADRAFRGKDLHEASFRYEHCLSVFKWLVNADPGWKKKGILDSDISEHAYAVSTPDECAKVSALQVACYLNLARVYHKKGDVATSVQACNAALGVDDACDKALLLRAQVRVAWPLCILWRTLSMDQLFSPLSGQVRMSPASAGATEQDMALKDAAAAAKVMPAVSASQLAL